MEALPGFLDDEALARASGILDALLEHKEAFVDTQDPAVLQLLKSGAVRVVAGGEMK